MSNNEQRVRDDVVPVYASHQQVVEIHWRDADGQLRAQRIKRTAAHTTIVVGYEAIVEVPEDGR